MRVLSWGLLTAYRQRLRGVEWIDQVPVTFE
jgi:hypothetical protein